MSRHQRENNYQIISSFFKSLLEQVIILHFFLKYSCASYFACEDMGHLVQLHLNHVLR